MARQVPPAPRIPIVRLFVTEAYKYWGAYWVEMDRFTPGTAASIDAAFTGANRLEITTRNLDGFTLRLAGRFEIHRSYSCCGQC